MTLALFISFLIYASITAITPGPSNILTLNAIVNYGYKRSAKLIYGIYVGYFAVMAMCGLVSNILILLHPNMLTFLKIFGALYIFYLAYKIATSKPSNDNEEVKDSHISFFNGFILQFINIKIILYGITIFTSYVLPFYTQFYMTLIFIVLTGAIGSFGTFLWVITGKVFQKFLQKHYKIANSVMAILLALSGVQILLTN